LGSGARKGQRRSKSASNLGVYHRSFMVHFEYLFGKARGASAAYGCFFGNMAESVVISKVPVLLPHFAQNRSRLGSIPGVSVFIVVVFGSPIYRHVGPVAAEGLVG